MIPITPAHPVDRFMRILLGIRVTKRLLDAILSHKDLVTRDFLVGLYAGIVIKKTTLSVTAKQSEMCSVSVAVIKMLLSQPADVQKT